MKLLELSIDYEREFLEVFAKIQGGTHDERIKLVIDDSEGEKLKDFSCTCKANTIKVGMKHPQIKCKHIRFLLGILNKAGWEIEE